MERCWYVYILCNKKHWTLYVWVTSNLYERLLQHKSKEIKGFTQKYWCTKLIYREKYSLIIDAIEREKQIKAWSRKDKIKLIESINPERNNLAESRNEWDF